MNPKRDSMEVKCMYFLFFIGGGFLLRAAAVVPLVRN